MVARDRVLCKNVLREVRLIVDCGARNDDDDNDDDSY
jgi:hypothetical protein